MGWLTLTSFGNLLYTRSDMKLFILALALAVVNCSYDQEWENFKLRFEKGFRSIVHESERKAVFIENLREIEKHNGRFEIGLTTYKKGINYYSDWTWDEFKHVVLMKEQVSKVIYLTQLLSPFFLVKSNFLL